ncbi:VWA domain-containing protein, partial [Rhizobiales bacterium L72]|nr:VWA domain-containing protein [Propylenella binzhouense]
AGDPRRLEAALDREPDVRARLARLVRAAKVGRHVRLRRQAEGAEIDLDAAIDAAIAIRSGTTPDTRIFRSSTSRDRDLAVMVLVDVSESTRARATAAGESVLDIERTAVALLAEALDALRDPLALRAFASSGRDDVRLLRLKEFAEPYGGQARARLAGLEPGLSTRLGAALRHSGAELAAIRAFRKLLIVLTDGEPSDIDVEDPEDLVEDARRAVAKLRTAGIDTFGVTLDPSGVGSGARIFGAANHMPVRRLTELPQRLADLYFRLARA